MIYCPREADVLDAIVFAREAGVSADALAGHVAGCPICSDLAAILSGGHWVVSEPAPSGPPTLGGGPGASISRRTGRVEGVWVME